MEEVFIIAAARTPIGRILGGLERFSAPDLGAFAIKEAIKRAKIEPEHIGEVIMGCVLSAGIGQSPSRIASLKAGVPYSTPVLTINKVCGSGLKSVVLAAQSIKLGDYDLAVAGGMESMTNAPHISFIRKGQKYGDTKFIDHMVYDGLWCSFNNLHMGELAEYTAEKANISREELDKFSYESHKKAVQAQKDGKFKDEIVPIEIKSKKGTQIIETDEGPREDTTIEKLSSLPPAFKKDGKITAGNASQLSDGAGAVVLASGKYVKEIEAKPIARITGYSTNFVEPKELFFAPVGAIKKLVKKLGLKSVNDFDLIELNEAFASQVLADVKELELDTKKLNVNGGAIALGHPIGASGTRILVSLVHSLKNRNLKTGLSALCLGGGGAIALSIEIV